MYTIQELRYSGTFAHWTTISAAMPRDAAERIAAVLRGDRIGRVYRVRPC